MLLLLTPAHAMPKGRGRQRQPGADLRVAVTASTARRYVCFLGSLAAWLQAERLPQLEEMQSDIVGINAVLVAYLMAMYKRGEPVSNGTYTLAAVQFRIPLLRGHLQGAWHAMRRWHQLEPGELRVPLPQVVLHAMVVVATAWQWPRLGAVLWLMFQCLLRPSEVCGLLRHHLRLPMDFGADAVKGVVTIVASKTATRAARIQSVVIHDRSLLSLLEAVFGDDPANVLLCPGAAGPLTATSTPLGACCAFGTSTAPAACGGAEQCSTSSIMTILESSSTTGVGRCHARCFTTCSKALHCRPGPILRPMCGSASRT